MPPPTMATSVAMMGLLLLIAWRRCGISAVGDLLRLQMERNRLDRRLPAQAAHLLDRPACGLGQNLGAPPSADASLAGAPARAGRGPGGGWAGRGADVWDGRACGLGQNLGARQSADASLAAAHADAGQGLEAVHFIGPGLACAG